MHSFESVTELKAYIFNNVINTAEACEILGCSRQNIDDLVKRKKLIPIKVYPRDKLFFKPDVLERVKAE